MGKLLRVCVIGDAQQPEFQYALSNIYKGAYICQCPTLDVFFQMASSPDAVVLLQSYPGEYSLKDVDKIIQFNPIAALILVTSSWGEGERRTGTPIKDAIRIAWYDFPCWFMRQKTLFDAGRLSQLSLPLSASDAQRAELDSRNDFPARTDDVFWVFSNSAIQRKTFSRFYGSLGAKVWSGELNSDVPHEDPLSNPTRIIVVPDFMSNDVLERTAQLKTLNSKTTICVIVYQPRIEEIASLKRHGADLILSQDFYQYSIF